MHYIKTISIVVIFNCLFSMKGIAQSNVHHWESAVLSEEIWRYRPGNTEPPIGWQNQGFDDSFWGLGEGGIGYGDLDDNTIISETWSVYLRKEFQVTDTSKIELATLYADYDDAFIAYLNGVEIARANIGTSGDLTPYNEPATVDHEAQLYQGGLPEPFLLDKNILNQLLINGTNTIAIQVNNRSNTSSDLSSNFYLLFGINDESNEYAPLPDWYNQQFVSSNLPLLVINTSGVSIPDEPKIEAHLGIIDKGQSERNFLTDAINGYDGKIGIEIRGSSSQMFPKKNYGFETRNDDSTNNNVSLLGMPTENDWVLYGPYSDKSLIRNVLSYHIGWQIGKYTPRTRWCEVFINNQYRGIYVLTERIKRDVNRVDIAKVRPEDISGDELTGGYIFSIDRGDSNVDDGWDSPYTSNVFFKYQDPSHDELMTVQKDYLKNYVTSFEEAMKSPMMPDVYDQFIDVDSWVDYWIATEMFKHIDGYKLSFFMYKKKESNGGKIHFGPLWDLNLAYGNANFGQSSDSEGWSYQWASSGSNRPFWILDLLSLPQVQDQIHCRWNELRQAGLHTDSLLQFIEENVLLIEEARIRNFDRWEILGQYIWPNDFVGNDYQEELVFLKNWLSDRLNWMDDNMVGECINVSSLDLESPNQELKIYPNPFADEIVFFIEAFDQNKRPLTSEKGSLRVFDLLGNELLKTDLEEDIPKIVSLNYLQRGIYFYQLEINKEMIATGKLIKQ